MFATGVIRPDFLAGVSVMTGAVDWLWVVVDTTTSSEPIAVDIDIRY